MDETAVLTIQKYIDDYLLEPRSNGPRRYLDQRSYSRWAAYEIQNRIIDEVSRLPPHITGRDLVSPIDVILEFISDMDYYHSLSDNKQSNLIFSIAIETAKNILYLFL